MKNRVVSLIFSKDRALQLRATIESFVSMCQDFARADIYVLYRITSNRAKEQYDKLESEFPFIHFVYETVLADQIKVIIKNYDFIFFQVDDNIFIRNFSIQEPIKYIGDHEDVIGFSLRLGANISYCYMLRCSQRLPIFSSAGNNVLKFNWTEQEYGYGYPLEVSGSIYRVMDILSYISVRNMPRLVMVEGYLNIHKRDFEKTKPCLLCYKRPVVFSLPINNTSGEVENRAGEVVGYTVDELMEKFDQGLRINTSILQNFESISVQQEVPIEFC